MTPSNLTLHETNMRHAIRAALRNPQRPFGAVLVDAETGIVVGASENKVHENPILHAELAVLHETLSVSQAKGLALYSTGEPCPMCAAAAEFAGISAVYFGVSIDWLASHGWKQILLSAADLHALVAWSELRIQGGILEAECADLFLAAR